MMAGMSIFQQDGALTDDYGQPLDASASPGLATLPAQNQPPESFAPPTAPSGLGFAGGAPSGSEADATAPGPSALNTPQASAAASSGLGLADFKSKRSGDDMEYLKSLPVAQKVGLMLQEVSAGIRGGPSPIEAMLANKQKRETEFRNEIQTTIKSTQAGIEMVKKVSPGPARDALIDQIVRQMGGDPMVKSALMAAGTAQEDSIKDVISVISNPRVQSNLAKASGGDPEKARKLLSDKDFMDNQYRQADSDSMPELLGKVKVISRAMAQMPQYKGKEGMASFTLSDLAEQNAKLPPEFKLTDAEMGAAKRNEVGLIMYGLKPDDVMKKQAEFEATAPQREAERIAAEKRSLADKKEMADYTKSLKEAPAPTVTEIADPNDPTKSIKIDAKTNRKIGDSPTGPKEEQARAKQVTQLSKGLEQAGLPRANAILLDVEKALKDTPNLAEYLTGPKSLIPDAMVEEKVRFGRQALDKMFNIELKDRSGAAVTPPEMARLKDEYGRGMFKTAAQITNAVEKARGIINDHYRSQAAGFGPDVLQAYNDNLTAVGGTPVIDISRKSAAAGKAPAVGTVMKGYRFKGGDPANPASWEKAS
jgi:hypothetical protein